MTRLHLPQFRELANYPEWTHIIVRAMAQIVDDHHITLIQTALTHASSHLHIPTDYAHWLNGDVLQVRARLETLREAVTHYGLFELSLAIDAWHKRLSESRALPCDEPVLCCGAGAVVDIELSAEELIQQLSKSGDPTLLLAQTRYPTGSVSSMADVVACLWQVARQTEKGLKPFIDSPDLENQLATLQTQDAVTTLGGAPAIMAETLQRIGVPTAVHWPYHSEMIGKYGQHPPYNKIPRVVFNGSDVKKDPFHEVNINRPVRRSFIFNLQAGSDLAGVPVLGDDRVIFRTRRYRLDNQPLSQIICVNHRQERYEFTPPPSWHPTEWPSIPLIGTATAGMRDNTYRMQFEIASDQALHNLAQQYRRLIWSGLQALDDPGWDDSGRAFWVQAISHQLTVLHGAGCQVYVELSGVPTFIANLREILRGRVHCIGINQTELAISTGHSPDRQNPAWVWPYGKGQSDTLLDRYYRACHLANYFETDLFVKGNDCSLYITQNCDEVRLQHIVKAILVAKMAVVGRLLDRAGARLVAQPSLAEKGFMSLLQFADALATDHDNPALCTSLVQHGYAVLGDHAVIAVPVPWPQEVQGVNPTGAGDTIASVVAALLPP